MAIPTLQIEQYQFRDDGILLNGPATLPFVDVAQVQGLDSSGTRQTTKDIEGQDGGSVESKYETLRTVVVDAIAYTDPYAFDTFMDQLEAAFEPNDVDQPFYWMTDNGMRVVYGKSQGLKWTKSNTRNYGKQAVQFTILCGDPRKYSPDVVSSGAIVLGSVATGGRGYNKGYTFGYGSAVTQSAGSITPGGTRDTPGLYTITGPITNPVIINDTLGLQWSIVTTIPTGDALIINPKYKTVRLKNSGASRRGSFRGLWWYLQKGQNNFRLQGSGGSGATNLTITAQRAWR